MQFNDLLNEVCKFSAMRATTALSKFLKIPIGMEMKLVEVKDFNDINMFANSREEMVSIFLPITGSLPGASFFLYTKASALSLCDILFNKKIGTSKSLIDAEISALSEVANIVIGNFLTTFAQSLQVDMLMHRSPIFELAPINSTLKKRLPQLKEKMSQAVLSISFGFHHINIQGFVVIIFSEKEIQNILTNISSPTIS